MKLLHISDTFGVFTDIPDDVSEYDVIVHSGNIAPNFRLKQDLLRRIWRGDEEAAQCNWYFQFEDFWRAFIGHRAFLYVLGDRDIYDPGPLFRSWGLDAVNVHHEPLEIDGVLFRGWHHVNKPEADMTGMIQKMLEHDMLLCKTDVLVSHAPMAGVLDNGHGIKEFGPMFDRLGSYKPRLLLHGHVSETFGEANYKGIHISNAATGWRAIQL